MKARNAFKRLKLQAREARKEWGYVPSRLQAAVAQGKAVMQESHTKRHREISF